MYWGSVSIIQSDSYPGLSQNKQLSLVQWLSQIIILTFIGPGEYFLSNHTQQCISYRYTFTIFHCLYRYFFIHIHMWIGMWSTVYIQQIHTIVQSYSLLWVLKSSRGNLCIHVHVFKSRYHIQEFSLKAKRDNSTSYIHARIIHVDIFVSLSRWKASRT